ncbi:MAG TPA: hypothetical protein VGP63_03090 [Planctomycetaceae bacterium]|jgi:hypothetical protein|nr:hypothetical protein [Planctomycetaceae bacterium]
MSSGDRKPDSESMNENTQSATPGVRLNQNLLLCLGAGGLGLATIVIIVVAATKQSPTAAESLMLGVLISVFSVLAAVVVSHIYYKLGSQSASQEAKRSYDETIRTFARKAAEKVFNLSNEFDRLAESLRTAIDEGDEEESNKLTLLVLREKILSAIHILETLKSMNDTSLSDWRGIIGEDIQLQRQRQLQISEELEEQRELLGELESRVTGERREQIEQRLQQVERRVHENIAALPFLFRPPHLKPKKREVQIVCPGCGVQNTVLARSRVGAVKLFQCEGCEHFVDVRFQNEVEFKAEMASEQSMKVACGDCKSEIEFNIPDRLGASVGIACAECGSGMTATMSKEGIHYHPHKKTAMTESFLNLVLANLPPRPWPQGVHKQIAQRMGVSNSSVSRALTVLIRTGRLEASSEEVPENGHPTEGA